MILINSIYQPCIQSFEFFKVSVFTSLRYNYIKNWYFHGQYKADGLGTNKISYNISNLRHVSKVNAHFQNNNKMFISLIQVSKRRKWKNIKNYAAEPYTEPYHISMMKHFCENTTAKIC